MIKLIEPDGKRIFYLRQDDILELVEVEDKDEKTIMVRVIFKESCRDGEELEIEDVTIGEIVDGLEYKSEHGFEIKTEFDWY